MSKTLFNIECINFEKESELIRKKHEHERLKEQICAEYVQIYHRFLVINKTLKLDEHNLKLFSEGLKFLNLSRSHIIASINN